MTMTAADGADHSPPPRFSLVNLRRDVLDLTSVLDGASTPGTVWSTSPLGAVQGLTVEQDGHQVEVSLDPGTFAIVETSSDAAPETLRALAHATYRRYLSICLGIGAFCFESVPIESADGAILQGSLRLAAANSGAAWLGQLPATTPASPRRLPLLSELTVIDTPPPKSKQDPMGSPA